MAETMTITLRPEVKKALDEFSSKAGVSPDEVVGEALKEHLDRLAKGEAFLPGKVPTAAEREEAMAEWMAAVRARADRYPPGHVVDDSRETIYRGRGE